jgi:hypothetical protein
VPARVPELRNGSVGLTRTRPIVRAISLGLLVGGGVTFITNTIIYEQPSGASASAGVYLRFWGLVFGSFTAGLVVLGVLALSLDARRKGIFLIGTAGVFGILGAGAACWIFFWKVPPFTLEGAWLYPLTTLLLLSAAFLGKKARDFSRGSKRLQDPSSPARRSDLSLW